MPRNGDVMSICEALENRLTHPGRPLKSKYRTPDGKFDRTAYQRELMRQRRAAAKVAKAAMESGSTT
jgi:hypothetical protein